MHNSFSNNISELRKNSADTNAIRQTEIKSNNNSLEKTEKKALNNSELKRPEVNVNSLGNIKLAEMVKGYREYIGDLKKYSEYPETIKNIPFHMLDLKKLSPEETGQRREEFASVKDNLKKEWEKENGCSWPKYETDVYSAGGNLIRRAGSDYDAHHIQPLGLNGKNTASNITPMHAEVHYDKQGIHASDSAYSRLEKSMGGN